MSCRGWWLMHSLFMSVWFFSDSVTLWPQACLQTLVPIFSRAANLYFISCWSCQVATSQMAMELAVRISSTLLPTAAGVYHLLTESLSFKCFQIFLCAFKNSPIPVLVVFVLFFFCLIFSLLGFCIYSNGPCLVARIFYEILYGELANMHSCLSYGCHWWLLLCFVLKMPKVLYSQTLIMHTTLRV